LPDNLDVFSWSVPFLSEKVTNMLFHIVKRGASDIPDTPGDSVDIEKVLHSDDVDEKMKRQLIIKGKVSSVAKMTRMFATLREESEMLLQIKNISPDGKLPRGLLLEGKPAIKNGKQSIMSINNM
jgi:serine/threonine-protein phosphatase 2B catalytic subunit